MANATLKRHRTTHINWKALAVVVALAVAAVAGYFVMLTRQDDRMRLEALTLVRRFQAESKSEPAQAKVKTDLALRNLNQYMATHPPDMETLELKAELMDKQPVPTEQLLAVAQVYESMLRLTPKGPESQKLRRRLVDLYIRFGDMLRTAVLTGEIKSDMATQASRYNVAKSHALRLIDEGAQDPEAHRLLAMALDSLAGPGQTEALNAAVREYRLALQGDPTDVTAARRLADLYVDRMKDPARAERVLDDLLKALPDSVETRLVRHKFFVRLRRDAKAEAELEAATKLAPDDASVLLSAAEDSLRRGDTEGARKQLEKVPDRLRDDVRFKMVEGLAEFGDERPDSAVRVWREGLRTSGGTDVEMTWWLAYALLEMDRIDEARPLIEQYARLVGPTPLLGFLRAVQFERTGRPAPAAQLLDALSQRLGSRYAVMVYQALGRVTRRFTTRQRPRKPITARSSPTRRRSSPAWRWRS